MTAGLAFDLPAALEAHEPPEARGLERDDVRLLVATRHDGRVAHATFRDLPRLLRPGDVLVVNASATLAAAIGARRPDGSAVRVHVSTPAPHPPPGPVRGSLPTSAAPHPAGRWWIVELRSADGGAPPRGVHAGEVLRLDGGLDAVLVAPWAGGTRLWLARLPENPPLLEHLSRHGAPVRYGHVPVRWALDRYQTVFAREPGSAEMPSAGRPFTPELVCDLVAAGVLLAPVTLHAGVSSPERHEPPHPERFAVPAATARLVNAVRGWGGRVVAVGTTTVRALETATDPDGRVDAAEGWTGLVVGPERGLLAADGLLTGWHEPRASHLALLEAAAGPELLARSYAAALEHGYLWHEFGDSHLVLP